jgi:hypothetical protein
MSNGSGDGTQPKGRRLKTQQLHGDPAAALASLLGIALGMLATKGLLEREELATIFSLAEGSTTDGAGALSVLDAAKVASDRVQADMG